MPERGERLTNEEYESIYNKVPRYCVDLLLVSEEGLLLTRRNIAPHVGLWHLPGGRLLIGESVEEAINRIASKEVGVNVSIEDANDVLFGVIQMPYDSDDGKKHSVSNAYRIQVLNNLPVKLDFQATEARFFTTLPDDMHPQHKEFIQKRLHLVK